MYSFNSERIHPQMPQVITCTTWPVGQPPRRNRKPPIFIGSPPRRNGGPSQPRSRGQNPPIPYAIVATSTALMECIRFSASSKTTLCFPRKTPSVTSRMSMPFSRQSRAILVSKSWKEGRQWR